MEPYRRRIFYYETDRMAIVHNSNYLRIFEEARLDHMYKSGVTYKRMEDEGVLIPQVEAYVKYIKPITYGDELNIRVRMTEFNGVKVKYEYGLFVGDEEKPSATGYTAHCFLDDVTRNPVSIKKRIPEVYRRLMVAFEKDTSENQT